MPVSPKEIFEHYVRAMMARDADAQAELFTTDGVFEAPLIPAGSAFPRRMAGREEIRRGLAVFHRQRAETAPRVNVAESRYVLHTTTDPDVFVVEIDTALDGAEGITTMSLVQIYRIRDGKISLLRDYFAPEQAG